MRAAAIPRSAWLAVGAASAAAAGALDGGPALIAIAGLLVLAMGGLLRTSARDRLAAILLSAGFGVILVAARLMVAPDSTALSSVDVVGAGPWTAEVISMGTPKAGAQQARLSIATPEGGSIVVAATLPSFPVVLAGSTIRVDGRLEPPPPGDPYGAYLVRSGASGSLRASSLSILRAPPWPSVQAIRDGAGDALRRSLPEPEAGLAAGILIGLRERVDRQLAADFATAGVSHVVAISGWNIAIVAALVAAMLRGRSRRIVGMTTGGVIVAYVIAAGASPSVVRAAAMAGVVLLARGSGRSVSAVAALALAATGLLLVDPAMIADAGFRLSVLATAGLLAWATPLGRWIGGRFGGRVPGWLAEGLGITLAAQAATLPDVVATFGRLSLVSPMVNLVVVPIVPAAMAGGALALLAGWLATLGLPPPIAVVAGLPGWLLLHVMVAVVRFAAALPFAAVTIPAEATLPAAMVAVLMVVGVLLAVRRIAGLRRRGEARRTTKRSRAPNDARRDGRSSSPLRAPTGLERIAVAVAAIALALSAIGARDAVARTDRIVMLDVGQGDAILVESQDGARMLVDGGPDPDRLIEELDAVVPPWDRRVDLVVLTHPHEDHVAGLPRVLERYRVGRVVEPGMHGNGPGWAAWDSALRHGPPRANIAAGDRVTLGDIRLEVRWPLPGTVPTTPATTGTGFNNVSIVLLGTASGRRFLLTGDAEQDVDPQMLAAGLPHLDVLKVAHHGSATATTAALLEATRPAVALVSVGAANTFGHPARSTLGRIRDAGARVYRTDLDGRVEVDLRASGVDVHVAGARGTAATPNSGYDRPDDRSHAARGGECAACARPTRLVSPPRLRRRRCRRLAGGASGHRGRGPGPPARGNGRAAARRGQAAGIGRGRPPPARGGVRGVARRPRIRGVGPAGPRSSGDSPGGRRACGAAGGRGTGGEACRVR